ncbi:hypothetical protein [Micromonospora sp. NPDC005806]|uniref:hypothetical protein n=1 Tax=Micromonospora sp. NPDC005806 TaxID=3364234 RepID=UPI0036908DEF
MAQRHPGHCGECRVPDELDRIALTQRLDDLRAVIAELERELRIDRDDGPSSPRRSADTGR